MASSGPYPEPYLAAIHRGFRSRLLAAEARHDQLLVKGQVAGIGVRTPPGARHDSRRGEPHITEELPDLLAGAPHAATERLKHDRLERGGVRVAQGAEVRDE